MSADNSTENSKKVVPGKPFKPGQTGNPGGRPKGAVGFRERCREFMTEDGWPILAEMANNPKGKDRFKAIELILGYAWGKPKQGVELTGEEGDAIKVIYTTKWGNNYVGTGEAD